MMDERFLKEEGAEVFSGNELLFKGALEAGAALLTGYPGSPISEFFDACYANRDLLFKHGIVADLANNEALAVARLNGARMAGVRALAVMKSVGLHVASDGLALGNLAEPSNAGGSLVVVGDDPWMESTQINNDSRYLAQHLHMPVLEPATFQEIKDWIRLGFELSSLSNLTLTYLVTTPQADGGGTVWTHPNRWPSVNRQAPVTLDTDRIDLDRNVLLPPRTWDREATLPQRFERLWEESRKRNVNRRLGPLRGPVGFIASGMAYGYLEHALFEMKKTGQFPILKLGLSYPLDPQHVLDFAKGVETLVVVEEKRGFVESQVVQILYGATCFKPVFGKKFPNNQPGFPEHRGLNPTIVMEKLKTVVEGVGVEEKSSLIKKIPRLPLPLPQLVLPVLPSRTPTFCPGCPHRDSSSVFLQIKKAFRDPVYMAQKHNRAPIDLVFHGETGCFTMLMFEPNEALMHNYSGMGLGGGTGAGADPFITNKQIVFLGDSTFFHSGIVAVSDSLKSGQDVTYVILDNKTTAMTGHQPTPGNDYNLMGEPVRAQNIEAITQAMVGRGVRVRRLRPDDHRAYRELLEETVLETGVKIVIADKECGLTHHRDVRSRQKRDLRRYGFLKEERRINVTPDVCENCLECTKITGCPGLAIEQTLLGPKIVTDLSACVSDGACVQVNACPAFEEIVIKRSRPVSSSSPNDTTAAIPFTQECAPLQQPQELTTERQCDPFCILITGVGGMGAGLLTEILVRAAQAKGFRVLFTDKKGLAVRHGAVSSQIILSRSGGVLSPVIVEGGVDLLLGLDALEASRVRTSDAQRTRAVVDTADHPTVRMLLGKDPISGASMVERLKANVRPEGWVMLEASRAAEYFLGDRLYANMVLLGGAYQKGFLPFESVDLEEALRAAVRPEDREENLRAFRLGRHLVLQPGALPPVEGFPNAATLMAEKTGRLKTAVGSAAAEHFRFYVQEAILALRLSDDDYRDLALRAYELLRYENVELMQSYLDLVLATARKDRAEWKYQATRAVLRSAFKVMAIKDEFYVADLLTREEKRERDARRYKISPTHGDQIEYRHFTRLEWVIAGRRLRWSMVTRDWQLGIIKRLKFLRRWLPGWHAQERRFRDDYLGWVQNFDAEDERGYELWLNVLRLPEQVTGYRDIRAPKMEEARRLYERLNPKSTHGGRLAHAPASEPLRR